MANPETGDLERRLRDNAMKIDASVSPQLRQRITASIHSAKQVRSVATPRDRTRSYWWASSLTGVTAALLIILLVGRDRDASDMQPENVTVTTTAPVATEVFRPFPLDARTADLTEPLEEELEHLQSDLEKARESVKRDLRKAL
jgi:hypothetical protein